MENISIDKQNYIMKLKEYKLYQKMEMSKYNSKKRKICPSSIIHHKLSNKNSTFFLEQL